MMNLKKENNSWQSRIFQWIQPELDPEKRSCLEKTLKREIARPGDILSVDFLSDSHTLKREALAVSEAFESVTNGMSDPQILSALDIVTEKSLLYPWKMLVLAVKAFYDKDTVLFSEYCRQIDKDTAPAFFVPLLKAGLSGDDLSEYSESEKQFVRAIFRRDTLVPDALSQLDDALESDCYDLYEETVVLLLKEILKSDRGLAERTALWCLERLQEKTPLREPVKQKIRSIFGREEGSRILALSSMDYDPDQSLLYWLDTLEYRMKGKSHPLYKGELISYSIIFRKLWGILSREYDLPEAYRGFLQDRFVHVSEHLVLYFNRPARKVPDIPGMERLLNFMDDIAGKTEISGVQPFADRTGADFPGRKQRSRKGEPYRQLELLF